MPVEMPAEKMFIRVKVDRGVWAEIKAEATRRAIPAEDYVGEILKKEVGRPDKDRAHI